jgi:DNA-binding GntR family transcriptional regulator
MTEEKRDALHRVEIEYREMPGLQLTAAQAARLCGLDPHVCRDALQELVAQGVLRTGPDERFRLATLEPERRMARADARGPRRRRTDAA